ncbi:hypothetical protein [uncultured Parabacteroides sp.]|uniref:hypothetical protein n=1 Tax=uncultured Parabacteroides sp. TaxID=512312 RepID=UPI00259AFC48|nr:hypothetical protein [uncultured Parabacteroides sp.]
MKKVNSLLKGSFILFLFPFILGAQKILEKQSGIFLFDQFADGKILLTDKRCIETQFNYNCEKQELYYKDGNEYQMMYNTSNIDTLYIQNRKFVPSREGASFFECIPVGEDILLVDWKVKLHYKGKRGAMGVVTQSGGQASVDVALMQNKGLSFPTNSVYKKDYQNTYRTCLDGQQVSFSNLKSFLKLYPDTRRKAIRQLVKEQSIHFDDPWQVAKLIVLCQTM